MKWVKWDEKFPEDNREYFVIANGIKTVGIFSDGYFWNCDEKLRVSKWLDETQSPAPDGWVSVEDGLPGEHRRYLCMMFNENCFIEEVCLFEYSTKKWLFQNKYVTVTHYQPLPQPPKQ